VRYSKFFLLRTFLKSSTAHALSGHK
jgi:hypothetical protein